MGSTGLFQIGMFSSRAHSSYNMNNTQFQKRATQGGFRGVGTGFISI